MHRSTKNLGESASFEDDWNIPINEQFIRLFKDLDSYQLGKLGNAYIIFRMKEDEEEFINLIL